MSGWGSSWDKIIKPMQDAKLVTWQAPTDVPNRIGIDLAKIHEMSKVIEQAKTDIINTTGLNKIPTHDPYTNPGAYIYYQCECGDTFDPQVKSFAALNNAAMTSKWKIRWGQDHYIPYCPKCVEEKGIE